MTIMQAYFSMDGYAAFIWPAYTITAFVLVVLLALSYITMRKNEALLKELKGAKPSDRKDAAGGSGDESAPS